MIGQFCILSKSEGYTKLGGVVDTPDDGAVIQVSLSGLVKWAVISRGKCQVLHLRRSSLRHQNMRGLTGWKAALQWTGPWGPDRLWGDSQHCTLGAKKANRILGCVRNILAESQGWWCSPFAELECCVQFWACPHKKDTDFQEWAEQELWRYLRDWSLSTVRRAWQSQDCLACGTEVLSGLIYTYKLN